MSVARGVEGFRQFTKSELIRVAEVATRKQFAAEQRARAIAAGRWGLVTAGIVLAFVAGAGSAWWAFR